MASEIIDNQPLQLSDTVDLVLDLDNTKNIHKTHSENVNTQSLFQILEQFCTSNRTFTLPNKQITNIYDSENLKAVNFQSGNYSPSSWYDNLIPFRSGDTTGLDNIKLMYCKYVMVNSTNITSEVYPPIVPTPMGTVLLTRTNTPLTDSAAIKSIVPVTENYDSRSLISLLNYHQTTMNSMYDEAPLLRLLIFIDLTQSPVALDRYNSVAQNLVNDTYSYTTQTVWAFDAAGDNRGALCPAVNSTRLFIITYTMYANILNNTIPCPIYNYIVVPVSRNWSGQTWLYPYIMSFTTTQWFSYSLYTTVNVINRNTGVRDNGMYFDCLPEAATVHIPNNNFNLEPNSNIVFLVLIDEATPLYNVPFYVGIQQINPPNMQFNNPTLFNIYDYLGRTGQQNYPAPLDYTRLSNDAMLALRHIVDTVCVPGMLRRCMTMASELTRARFHNNWIYPRSDKMPDIVNYIPNPNLVNDVIARIFSSQYDTDLHQNHVPETFPFKIACGLTDYTADANYTKLNDLRANLNGGGDMRYNWPNSATANTESLAAMKTTFSTQIKPLLELIPTPTTKVVTNRSRTYTPMFSSVADVIIGDYQLPIQTKSTIEQLQLAAFSRITPYHVFPKSYVSMGNGQNLAYNIPNFNSYKVVLPQYTVMEASGTARILLATQQFVTAPLSEQLQFIYADNLTLELTHFASLLAAVNAWCLAYFSINIYDLNYLTVIAPNIKIPIVDNYWVAATHGFINLSTINHPLNPESSFTNIMGFSLRSLLRDLTHSVNLEILHLHGAVLPWWYISAVAQKFTNQQVVPPSDEPIQFTLASLTDIWYGFYCTTDKSWMLMPFLSSNNQYDNPRFNFYPISHGNRQRLQSIEPISWNSDMYIDSTRLTQSLRLLTPIPAQNMYRVELQTLYLETTRWTPLQANWGNFISYVCPSSRLSNNYVYTLQASTLQYPDPLLDYLAHVPGIVISLATGDIAGAIAQTIVAVKDPINSSIKSLASMAGGLVGAFLK